MEYKQFELLIDDDNQQEGCFKGYGSIFGNVDCYGDVVEKGAFISSLEEYAQKNKKIPILWQHDPSDPIGFCSACEDEKGLLMDARLLVDDVKKAKEARALIKNRVISGLSIGYSVKNNGAFFDAEGLRHLTDLKLYEISIVTFPANEEATVDSVKTELTIRDAEHALIDKGFSRKRAKEILSKGYNSAVRDATTGNLRDAESAIKSINNILDIFNR